MSSDEETSDDLEAALLEHLNSGRINIQHYREVLDNRWTYTNDQIYRFIHNSSPLPVPSDTQDGVDNQQDTAQDRQNVQEFSQSVPVNNQTTETTGQSVQEISQSVPVDNQTTETTRPPFRQDSWDVTQTDFDPFDYYED